MFCTTESKRIKTVDSGISELNSSSMNWLNIENGRSGNRVLAEAASVLGRQAKVMRIVRGQVNKTKVLRYCMAKYMATQLQ